MDRGFFPSSAATSKTTTVVVVQLTQWVLCTVYETHKSHFSATFLLKIGLIVLFTHLKIILLQYFQFSIFNFSKINSIQTDPYVH